jgi:hypothetical protein
VIIKQTAEWYIPDMEYDQAWNIIMNQFKDYMVGGPKMVHVDMDIVRLDNA